MQPRKYSPANLGVSMSESQQTLKKWRKAHKVVSTYKYKPKALKGGYANRYLYVNVGTGEIKEKPVTKKMKDLFIGGKGFDLYIMWQMVKDSTKWDDPENVICFSGGPLCGTTTYPGAGKCLLTSISPLTGIPIDSNVGGYMGPLLKVAGFDALCLQGKSKKEVILKIDSTNNEITIEEAPLEPVDAHLAADTFHRMYSDSEEDRLNIACVAAGSGSDHSLLGCLNFSWWDQRRQESRLKQAGRGGIGTVFRNKKMKAIIVKTPSPRPTWTIEID